MKRMILGLCLLLALLSSGISQVKERLFKVSIGASGELIVTFRDPASRTTVIDSVSAAYGYQATVPDPKDPSRTIPNPVSEEAFVANQVEKYLSDVVRARLINAAGESARRSKEDEIKHDLPVKPSSEPASTPKKP